MPEVRVRLQVGPVHLEFHGRRAFFEQWIEPLVHAAYHHRSMEQMPPTMTVVAQEPVEEEGEASFQPSSPPQFNRFVGQVGARASDVDQRIMAFAFYLWNFERKDDFGLEQIAAFFRTVQDEPPGDLSERLEALADRKRFLEQRAEAEAWRLTSKGVNYVKNRLLA